MHQGGSALRRAQRPLGHSCVIHPHRLQWPPWQGGIAVQGGGGVQGDGRGGLSQGLGAKDFLRGVGFAQGGQSARSEFHL